MHESIAFNLRKIREERNLSLDKLSDLTGVSKSMLRQIETGQSNPTISTLWKIANGLHIPFTALLREKHTEVVLQNFKKNKPLTGTTAGYSVFPMVLFDPERPFETYFVEIEPGTSLAAEPHNGVPEEYVFVTHGVIEITVDSEKFTVESGNFIAFKADCPHHYFNPGTEKATGIMLIAYLG